MYCLPRDHTQFLLLKPLDTAHIESRDTVGVSLKGCDFAWRPLDLPAEALRSRDSVHEGAAAPKDHVVHVHARDEDDEITTESCHMPVLSDISFEVEQGNACDAAAAVAVNVIHGDHILCSGPGELLAVVGDVASGKSTLIQSILGETYCVAQAAIARCGRSPPAPAVPTITNISIISSTSVMDSTAAGFNAPEGPLVLHPSTMITASSSSSTLNSVDQVSPSASVPRPIQLLPGSVSTEAPYCPSARPSELPALMDALPPSTIVSPANPALGMVALQGRVAYVAQSPFIMNATLRDNILFGQV